MPGGTLSSAGQQREIVEQHVAQRPPSGACRVRAERGPCRPGGRRGSAKVSPLALAIARASASRRRRSRRDRCSCRSRGRCRPRRAASAPARGRRAPASRRRRSRRQARPARVGKFRLLAAEHLAEGGDQRIGEQCVEGLPAREGIAVMARPGRTGPPAVCSTESVTGAEKPRLSDRAGRSATPENRTTWRRLRIWMTPFSTLAPSTAP